MATWERSRVCLLTGVLIVLLGFVGVLIAMRRDSCGHAIAEAPKIDALRNLLNQDAAMHVFFDLDETLVMPNTPFIYGMHGSDAFTNEMSSCEKEAMNQLGPRMEAAYYSAPLQLVDPGLPALIASLRKGGRSVWALTSRTLGDKYEWHTQKVVEFLVAEGVFFAQLPSNMQDTGNDTQAGGMLFAGGESKDKGAIIARIMPAGVASVLVDNTQHKLVTAVANQQVCLQGIHFSAADDLEQSDASRRSWVCKELGTLGIECETCKNDPVPDGRTELL